MEQFAARGTDQAMRTAALYALLDQRDEISPEDLQAAVALVEYMAETVTYLVPETGTTVGNEAPLPVRVEAFIRAAGHQGVKSTEVLRKFGKPKAEMEAIIASLGTIETFKGKSTGGRPPIIYRYLTPEPGRANIPAVDETTKVTITTEPTLTAVPQKEESPSIPSIYNLDEVWEALDAQDTATAPTMPELPRGVDALRALMDGPSEAEAEEDMAEIPINSLPMNTVPRPSSKPPQPNRPPGGTSAKSRTYVRQT